MALSYNAILNVILTLQNNTKAGTRQILQAINNFTSTTSPGLVETLTFSAGPVTIPLVANQSYFVVAPQANANPTITIKQFQTDNGFQVDANRPFFLATSGSGLRLEFNLPITMAVYWL